MTPDHHPFPETLMSFASGALPNAIFALVACHLAMCRVCARDVRRLEQLGGVMLDRFEARPAEKSIGERAVERLPGRDPWNETEPDPETRPGDQLLPPLLARNLPIRGEISWQTVSPGVRQHQIALPKGSGQMRLLRLTPGESLPQRAHRADTELALVLQGALSGRSGVFVRGDAIEWTQDSDRSAKAAGDVDCVCLIASDAGASAAADPDMTVREPGRRAGPLALRLGNSLRSPAPLAACIALLIGVGLGWLLHGAPETGDVLDLIRVDGNRLIARGVLRDSLDVLPSGRETVASVGGREVRLDVKMTFEEQSGAYCRQYRIVASPSSGTYSGIACRRGADWAVRMHALLPPAASGPARTVPADAGANAAMDAVIGAWISGNPLVGKEEAAVIGKGWKK